MSSWKEFIAEESKKDYYKTLTERLLEDGKTNKIYPPSQDVFTAFNLTPLHKVKVVILGMDPYHGEGQAHGLSFSVLPECPTPPSLKNIFKEIKSDLNIDCKSPYLVPWATQGVLLLNSMLTVREKTPGSHKDYGWQTFTDNAISLLNDSKTPISFMLWGAFSKNKGELITNTKHLKLFSVHPSPLSAYNGFFGCKHFSQTNQFLINNNLDPINWQT